VAFPPLPQPIKAGTGFIDPERMKGWVGLVCWPVADDLSTVVVTHQLQVECRTGKSSQARDWRSTTVPRNQPNSRPGTVLASSFWWPEVAYAGGSLEKFGRSYVQILVFDIKPAVTIMTNFSSQLPSIVSLPLNSVFTYSTVGKHSRHFSCNLIKHYPTFIFLLRDWAICMLVY